MARQHRWLRHRRGRRHPPRRPVALRPPALRDRRGRRTRPVAAPPARQPVAPHQSPMAAASGIPGIDTTPKPADGLASSLTAMGPEARTMIGSRPTAVRVDPDTISTAPAASVPVAITRLPDVVGANAL